MSLVTKVRVGEQIRLHQLARPYFGYPEWHRNAWLLPFVYAWEPWYGEVIDRRTRRLYGEHVIATEVMFTKLPMENVRVRGFTAELRKQTGVPWAVYDDMSPAGIYCVRLSQQVNLWNPETNTGYAFALPWDEPLPEGWHHNGDQPP